MNVVMGRQLIVFLKAYCLEMPKWGVALLFLPLVSAAGFLAYMLLTFSLRVIPGSGYTFSAYADNVEGGASVIDRFSRQNGVVSFEYTLLPGVKYPYSGLMITSGGFLDLGKYETVTVDISASRSDRVRFILASFLKGFSDHSKPLSEVYLIKDVPVGSNKFRQTFFLNEFTVPDWWYTLNGLDIYDPAISPDLSTITCIRIENDTKNPALLKDKITIEMICFSKSKKPIISVSIIVLLYMTILFSVIRMRTGRKSADGDLPFALRKKIGIVDIVSQEEQKVISVVSEHYTDPELSVGKVAQLSGISSLKIPKIIKKRYGYTFPGCLNGFRISESMRLLEQSDMKIIEIAFAVGFSNVSQFNKHFRLLAKMTPKDFRRKAKRNNQKKQSIFQK